MNAEALERARQRRLAAQAAVLPVRVVQMPTISQEVIRAHDRLDGLVAELGLKEVRSTPATRDAAAQLDKVCLEYDAGRALREEVTGAITRWEEAWRNALGRRSP